MITIRDLTFWYSKRRRIFESLNLELDNGHIYGLLGKNGAGKTTLLKLISGLSFPKSGEAMIDQEIPGKRKYKLLSEIFLVPEEIYVPSLKAVKFAEIYGAFYPGFNYSEFLNYLEGFEVDKNQNLRDLSHGQKKKVMIAFGLACNTRYLFLDEPTNGLDIPAKATLRKVIASSFTEEKSIILSTHQVRDLQTLIDSAIILADRRIILNQSLEKIGQKLTFSHEGQSPVQEEALFSTSSELGPSVITTNHSGIAGDVDLETLFIASISIPEKIGTFFNQ
jgi:ABC-2 type transport system ATP-binding protein